MGTQLAHGVPSDALILPPDIDADLYGVDMVRWLVSNDIHAILYGSSANRAPLASKAFRGYARAADSGEVEMPQGRSRTDGRFLTFASP